MNAGRTPATLFTVEQRLALLRRYGRHAQAWATLQPGLAFIDVETSAGPAFVAMRRTLGVTIVLGDPIGDPATLDEVLDVVVAACPRLLFFQVGDATADRLRERHRLRTTPLGIEPIVDIANFSLRGRHKQTLRSARNHAERAGVVVEEVDFSLSLSSAPERPSARTFRIPASTRKATSSARSDVTAAPSSRFV
jgi:lysylphosphatidylglycerol synthetase-like protein (DUF2156 family)